MQNISWRTVLRFGLIGSVVSLYFSIIGMVEVFSERDLIGDFLNLGHLLLFGGMLAAGLLAAQNQDERVGSRGKLVAGSAAGALATLFPALLVLIKGSIEIDEVFINANQNLVDFITFNQGSGAGLIRFIVVSTAIGLLGAVYFSLAPKLRRAVGTSTIWVLMLSIFAGLVIQVMTNVAGKFAPRLFYDGESMRPLVAAIIFVAVAAISYYRQGRVAPKAEVSEGNSPEEKRARLRRRVFQFVILGAVMLIAPWILGSFLSQVLFEVGRFVLLGLGLNIVVGYAGLLDLGYVAFFAFGAYTMAILTTTTGLNPAPGLFNFWTALPVVVLVGVTFGVLLGFPVLRMRGDYLAIVTLGFGEIIRILALSDWLAPVMGGAQGVLKIPNPVLFGVEFDSPELMYYLVLFGSILAAFISIRLRDSRLGRQWMAMREDEDVAEAMGINLVQTKLLAFAIGAGFSALGGAIFAARLSNIFPHSFNLLISVNALSLIIVGGLGSIPGVIVGAAVLVGLPELLREFQEYRLLMYGILLIVMMLVRPEGFIPAEIFKRELHAAEESQPAK